MIKQLIINADDFGFTWGVSQGIALAMQHVVTSTTIMGNSPDLPRHLELLQGLSHRGFGAHLVLSAGAPVLPREQVPSLVRNDGSFHRDFRQATRMANPREVLLEWRAQMERIRQCGVRLTHIDSHHHVHLAPELTRVAIQLAEEYAIPAIRRLTVGDVCREASLLRNVMFLPSVARSAMYIGQSGLKYPERLMSLSERHLSALARLAPGIYEMFCHPGFVDQELEKRSSLLYGREEELRLLTAPSFAERLRQSGVELVNYGIFGG
ncbi:MAG: Carbohydrate deacetylase [Firmicutes bacterium]|nr:Carbohydrate deacetylase [Bacillota bacterium]